LLSKTGNASNLLVQVSSRSPGSVHAQIASLPEVDKTRLLPPVASDIVNPTTLVPAFEGADVIVSLVGIMHGTTADFERIQWKGAANVARAAKHVGAKLIHISAIGANSESHIPYARTKALGEAAVLEQCPDATVIRPSLVFGPGDGFFAVSDYTLHISVSYLAMSRRFRGLANLPRFYLFFQSSVVGPRTSNQCLLTILLVRLKYFAAMTMQYGSTQMARLSKQVVQKVAQ
jgi:nucleoside-diphosphate-sugar epimerase